ncbi:ATP-binding protein [Streptomyces sp. NRRL F-5126]|uniref:ATP-binding protein n=1 Tax=Streptomyces sp. NRRL F-5126 TaxID=1463857 RepID=UPI00068CA433|nr:ATP-binding protein [Streptomyces sp. NRRL F-5126]
MDEPRIANFKLARHPSSVPCARTLLRARLGEWRAKQDTVADAELVLSELVTNAVRVRAPGDRMVGVRIECRERGGLLRLEVSDAGKGSPEVRSPGEEETCGRGLLLVSSLAYRWGVKDRLMGVGKTIWAELVAPGSVPGPSETEVAAVNVRAGQCVRVWGGWQAVRSVRSERYASGGLAVVIGLEDGPALRLHAAEPVLVRDAGQAPGMGAAVVTVPARE